MRQALITMLHIGIPCRTEHNSQNPLQNEGNGYLELFSHRTDKMHVRWCSSPRMEWNPDGNNAGTLQRVHFKWIKNALEANICIGREACIPTFLDPKLHMHICPRYRSTSSINSEKASVIYGDVFRGERWPCLECRVGWVLTMES